MKLENVTTAKEKELTTLLIMNTEFCDSILPILNTRLLQIPYAKHIAMYVQEYYSEYSTAPALAIQSIFDVKRTYLDEEIAVSIAMFLQTLSESYDPHKYKDIPFYVSAATQYIRELELENLEKLIKEKRLSGRLDEAESLIGSYKQVGAQTVKGVSLKNDIQTIIKAFDEDNAMPLFSLQGALGKISNFYRGDLSAVISTSKGGKSWWLQHLSQNALEQGCTVLHVNLEMREEELYQRFWRGLNFKPLKTGTYSYSKFIPDLEPDAEITEDTMYRIERYDIEREGVQFDDIERIKRTLRMRYPEGDVIFASLPSYTTTVEDIELIIKNLLLYKGIKIDLLVVDYADLLGSKEREYRHKLNDIWTNLRRVSQEHRIHVTTVTQSNAEGLDGKEIGLSAIAEDKRKQTHVSMMLAMWGTEEDRRRDVVRMKNLISRYKIDSYDTVCVLTALDLGRFVVDSCEEKKLIT